MVISFQHRTDNNSTGLVGPNRVVTYEILLRFPETWYLAEINPIFGAPFGILQFDGYVLVDLVIQPNDVPATFRLSS